MLTERGWKSQTIALVRRGDIFGAACHSKQEASLPLIQEAKFNYDSGEVLPLESTTPIKSTTTLVLYETTYVTFTNHLILSPVYINAVTRTL